jgi:hypothetical protein
LENLGYPVERINRQVDDFAEYLKEFASLNANVNGFGEGTKSSQMLQEIIMERAYLLYHNYSESKIRNDENWLKKLTVEENESFATAILKDINTGLWILYVTSNLNLLDVSECIAKNIYKSYEQKDILSINILLNAPLSTLKNMGYPLKGYHNNSIGDTINTQASTTIVNESQTSYCDIKPGISKII